MSLLIDEEIFPSPTDVVPGPWTILGDCELYEELGRGGMGIVYRARHLKLGRWLAVKVLRGGELADGKARRLFQAEAETVAQLQHPGIVTIHDVGEEQGVCWYSMELVPGRTLDELVRHAPMGARDAAVCLRAISTAVEHAHQHGVLHRDLKPSNIILDADGNPRVTDFGIARRTVGGTVAQTHGSGQMLGSPGYVAPELSLEGRSDARTDVYGLGALLYHLLTGRPPFQGPTLDSVLLQLRESEPLPPHRLNPTVPRDLETICLKCLARNPSRRYDSAQAVTSDLTRFLGGEPISARPRSALEMSARWMRRHWLLATLALSAVMALVLGSIISMHEAALARSSEQRSRDSEQRTQRVIYARDIALAQQELTQQHHRGLDLLQSQIPAPGATDLRGWEWDYLMAGIPQAESVTERVSVWRASMSPDGRYFAQGREEGGINVWETSTRKLLRVLPAGQHSVTNVQWLGDSRRLASCNFDADVRVQDAFDGTMLAEYPALHAPLMEIAWSADGQYFAHTDWSGEIILRTADGKISQRYGVPPAGLVLVWHPQRPLLAIYGENLRAIFVVDASAPGQPIQEWPMPQGSLALAWQSTGERIVIATRDGRMQSLDLANKAQVLWEQSVAEGAAQFIRITPDGTRIVLATSQGNGTVFRAADGAIVRSMMVHKAPGFASMSVSDDYCVSIGKLLGLRLWPVEREVTIPSPNASSSSAGLLTSRPTGSEIALHVPGQVKTLLWSPDGKFLHATTVQMADRTRSSYCWRHPVWDRMRQEWIESTLDEKTSMGEWSPDGKHLARILQIGALRHLVILDYPGETISHQFALEGYPDSLNWDPSATRVAVSCPGQQRHQVIICDLNTGLTSSIPAYAYLLDAPELTTPNTWSPDSRSLLICDKAWHYDVTTARPVAGWPRYDNENGKFAIVSIAWHPNSCEIATGRETGILEIRTATDAHILRQTFLHSTTIRCLAWHPTQPRLAISSSDGTVKIIASDTIEELLSFPGIQPDVRALAWSPDGKILASGASDGSIVLRSAK